MDWCVLPRAVAAMTIAPFIPPLTAMADPLLLAMGPLLDSVILASLFGLDLIPAIIPLALCTGATAFSKDFRKARFLLARMMVQSLPQKIDLIILSILKEETASICIKMRY